MPVSDDFRDADPHGDLEDPVGGDAASPSSERPAFGHASACANMRLRDGTSVRDAVAALCATAASSARIHIGAAAVVGSQAAVNVVSSGDLEVDDLVDFQ